MPKAAPTPGTRPAYLRIVARSSSLGDSGTDAGFTSPRTGAYAAASSTAAHRSAPMSAVSPAPAASTSAVRSSVGRIVPAFGGRDDKRNARTTRPALTARPRSSSQFACSVSTRCSSFSRSCAASWRGLVVARGGVGGDDDRAQVAQVELVGIGHGGIGAVAPIGGAHAGEQLLGEVEQLGRVDRRLAGGGALLVLGVDGLAHRGDAALEDLLGDRLLLRAQLGEHGLAMGTTGAQSLRLRSLRQRRRRGTRRTLAPLTSLGSVAALSACALLDRCARRSSPDRHALGRDARRVADRDAHAAAAAHRRGGRRRRAEGLAARRGRRARAGHRPAGSSRARRHAAIRRSRCARALPAPAPGPWRRRGC